MNAIDSFCSKFYSQANIYPYTMKPTLVEGIQELKGVSLDDDLEED